MQSEPGGDLGRRLLPGLRELTSRVHRHGAKIAIQLQHAGKVAVRDMVAGRPLLVPSIAPSKGANDLLSDLTAEEVKAFVANLAGPRPELQVATEEDIEKLLADFAAAAERARRAGFDGVELHAGHGYILSSFLSPASNLRDDRWGGSLENRARLLCETLRAVKRCAGEDFPVWFRMDALEFRTAGGIGLEDAARTAALAEAAGADAVHVSAYADSTSGVGFTDAPLVHREEGYVEFAARVKREVDIPVIAVGRIEPIRADEIIRDGGADFIAMGRKLLADPALPRKLAEGRAEDVRPCIYCYTCVAQIFVNRPLYCTVNPTTGHEFELELTPAAPPRHVLVIGGGPAGMEAARIAALRGHRVTLCEKSDRLGGTLSFSALVNPPNGRLARWLETQVRRLGVEVRLCDEMTPERVGALSPDATVVAVGARSRVPELPGADLPHVLSSDDLQSLFTAENADRSAQVTDDFERARQLTRASMPLGRRVAVVGGGIVGVELAEFLAERRCQVTVLEPGPDFAPQMAPPRRWRSLHDVRELGVELVSRARVLRITARDLCYQREGEAERVISADSVIWAEEVEPNHELADSLGGIGGEVFAIGDCSGVGYIEGAIHQASRVARAI